LTTSTFRTVQPWGQRLGKIAPVFAGVILTLTTTIALVALGWYEFQTTLTADRDRSELEARVLDDHATRAIDSASVTLTYLARQLDGTTLFGGLGRADLLLEQAVTSLSSVRSLNVVDSMGLVVASSIPTESGQRIDLQRLGALPQVGKEQLGAFFTGRGLSALAAHALPKSTGGVGSLPLLRSVKMNNGQEALLVALINPDAFSNFQLLTLNNPENAAYLTTFSGDLLASTGATTLPLGASLRQHPVFSQYLPATEHASYIGAGVLPNRQVGAFRLSHGRPLVVIVEHPYTNSVKSWFVSVQWFGAAGLLMVIFLALMTTAVQRGLKARAAVNAQLKVARLSVVRRERELRVLVKSVQELIFRTDAKGVLIYVNKRWDKVRGKNGEHALSIPLVAMVDIADRAPITALFSMENTAELRTATGHMRALDGGVRRFDIAVVPLRSGATLVGFAGSAVDVTERYKAEQALQKQLAFIGLMFELSPLPIATLDAGGRYISVNRAWENFMGQTHHTATGRMSGYFMSPADAALHAGRDQELRALGGTLRYEAKVRHGDGTRRDVVITKVLVPGDDTHGTGLLSTMMDVSEFRQAERATREAREAAEESSRAKTEFIGNISHELRTPLQSILGFSELGIARGREAPKLRSMFTEIHASGTRMLALVNDLLDVSKIESAVGAINLERADLRGLVQSVLHELSPLMHYKHLVLTAKISHEPLIAKVDSVRFQQVIRNVTANAIKFSPEGGEITVYSEVMDNATVCIHVRDQGVGIPPAELQAIFEAFVQSSTTKNGSGGTGLGLAICKKILDAHGGRIEANNMPDGGAVFSIYLPMRQHLDRDTGF
jgi:PAS domain S-box-containing protein